MTKLLFGIREEAVCIIDAKEIVSPKGDVCLAYKTTTHFFVAGIYVTNDGYALKVKNTSEYQRLDAEAIRTYQASGALPTPLPAYSLPLSTYVSGYSLWLCILVAIASVWVKSSWRTRKTRKLQELRHVQPISYGPPALVSSGDRFIASQVVPLLRPGEQVQHQAYGVDRDISEDSIGSFSPQGVFGILTTERLVLVQTRIGAFGVLLENNGVEWIERFAILAVREHGDVLTFDLAGGGRRQIVVKRGARGMSNQLTFLRDVPRLLSRAASMPPYPGSNPFVAQAEI